MVQSAAGAICLTWDFMRSRDQEILMAIFTEADVLSASAEAIARVKPNRHLVSKGRTK
jgi:hypothetical protein